MKFAAKGDSGGPSRNRDCGFLDDKRFAHIEKFTGKENGKFKTFLFDFEVAVGRCSGELAKALKELYRRGPQKRDLVGGRASTVTADQYNPAEDGNLDPDLHNTYWLDLYSILVTVTEGDAKAVLRGMREKGWKEDGFKALMILRELYDGRTGATLLKLLLKWSARRASRTSMMSCPRFQAGRSSWGRFIKVIMRSFQIASRWQSWWGCWTKSSRTRFGREGHFMRA